MATGAILLSTAARFELERDQPAWDGPRDQLAEILLSNPSVEQPISDERNEVVELLRAQFNPRLQQRIEPLEDWLDRAETKGALQASCM